jgi:hypothetical protein
MAESPTEIQLRVAAALAVDIARDSRTVAAARLYDAVAEAIGERHACRPASARQVEFALSLDLDVRSDSLRVASAKIADELERRNRAALVALNLQPGDRVLIRKRYETEGQRHEWTREFTISSIDVRGRLHFKGGNGDGAWPTEVGKVATAFEQLTTGFTRRPSAAGDPGR